MARKHNLKRNRVKQPINTREVRKALDTPRVTEVPEGTPKSVPVKQEDGSVKFFLVEREDVTVIRGRAMGSTLTAQACGKENKPENMAPKGARLSKSEPGGRGDRGGKRGKR